MSPRIWLYCAACEGHGNAEVSADVPGAERCGEKYFGHCPECAGHGVIKASLDFLEVKALPWVLPKDLDYVLAHLVSTLGVSALHDAICTEFDIAPAVPWVLREPGDFSFPPMRSRWLEIEDRLCSLFGGALATAV